MALQPNCFAPPGESHPSQSPGKRMIRDPVDQFALTARHSPASPCKGEVGSRSEPGGGLRRSPPDRFAVDLPFSRGGKERLRSGRNHKSHSEFFKRIPYEGGRRVPGAAHTKRCAAEPGSMLN